jgi:hypothetical protein
LNAAPPEDKRLGVLRDHDPDGALRCCNTPSAWPGGNAGMHAL